MSATESTTHPGYSPELHDTADRIVRRYPVSRSALLPLLHLVQSEDNCITPAGIAFCAEKVGLTRAEVGAVATFYTMYKREPVGDWLLSVCTNPTCKQKGGQQIYENYVAALGGKHSDPDTKVTVEHAECLGICDGAPVVQVNYEMFGPLTVEEGDQLLAACRKGEPPVSPWSGETPPTFAELERDLSGANDAWEAELHKAAQQQIAYAKPPTYRTGETDIPVTHPGGDPAGIGGEAFRAAASGQDAPAAEAAEDVAPEERPVDVAPEERPLDIDGEPVETPVSPEEFVAVVAELEAEAEADDADAEAPVAPAEFAEVVDELDAEHAAELSEVDVDGEPVQTPVSPREFADTLDEHADDLHADDDGGSDRSDEERSDEPGGEAASDDQTGRPKGDW